MRSGNRYALGTASIAIIGFALFLSAVWTARNEASLVPDYTLYIARFVKVAGCFTVAFLFRSHIPSIGRMLGAGAVLVGMHLAVYAVMFALPPDSEEYFALGIFSGVFSGLGEACIILLYAHLLSTFAPRLSAVAIPAFYLLNEVLYCSTLYMPTEIIVVLRGLGKAAGVGLLLWCVIRKRSTGSLSDEYPLQYGLPRTQEKEPMLRFLSGSQDWMLILAGTTLFPFVFGLIAQISSNMNTNSGLYDTVNEFVAIGLLVLLVGYAFLRGARFSFDEILYLSFPLFATGCLLLPMFWGSQVPFAGMLVKCGYTIYQVLFWVLLARKCFEDLRHTYLYFGIFYGLFELATAAARLIASNLYYTNVLDFQFASYAALFSLWLIALYGLLFFAISKRWKQGVDGVTVSARSALGDVGAGVKDEDFSQKLERFCIRYDLSDREREVLVESIHGYSMENIGKKLFISRETVKTYLRRVYVKAGVSGKQELISFIDHEEKNGSSR